MKLDKKKKISIAIFICIVTVATAGIIMVKVYNPEEESFFMPCLFNLITGIKCPGCGMTRAAHYLVTGDILKAEWYNAMILPLIAVILYAVYKYFRYLLKDEEVLDKHMENVLKVFLAMLIIFAVVRNLTTIIF